MHLLVWLICMLLSTTKHVYAINPSPAQEYTSELAVWNAPIDADFSVFISQTISMPTHLKKYGVIIHPHNEFNARYVLHLLYPTETCKTSLEFGIQTASLPIINVNIFNNPQENCPAYQHPVVACLVGLHNNFNIIDSSVQLHTGFRIHIIQHNAGMLITEKQQTTDMLFFVFNLNGEEMLKSKIYNNTVYCGIYYSLTHDYITLKPIIGLDIPIFNMVLSCRIPYSISLLLHQHALNVSITWHSYSNGFVSSKESIALQTSNNTTEYFYQNWYANSLSCDIYYEHQSTNMVLAWIVNLKYIINPRITCIPKNIYFYKKTVFAHNFFSITYALNVCINL